MSDLTFTRSHLGYVAEVDGPTEVIRWMILNTAARRWEIVSITTGMERRRHGHAYTLREAKEIVGRWHAANLERAAVAR